MKFMFNLLTKVKIILFYIISVTDDDDLAAEEKYNDVILCGWDI